MAGGCAALGWGLGEVAIAAAMFTAAVLSAVLHVRTNSGAAASHHEISAHLARARRRDEPADLVVIRVANGDRALALRLQASLRVTDSTYVGSDASHELIAMVDRTRLNREAFEARMNQLAGAPLTVGWAAFPEDGHTLASLLASARSDCLMSERIGDVAIQQPVGTLAAEVAAP